MRPLNFINVPSVLSSAFFLAIAWFVASRTTRPQLGRRFVAFCVTYGFYSLSLGLLALFLDKRIAYWAAHAVSATGVFTIPIMYDFLLTGGEVKPAFLKAGRRTAYGVASIFAVFFAWQMPRLGLKEWWWGYYPARSEGLPAFMVFITVLISHAEWILWKRSCESRSVNEKNQLRILFWSTLLTIPSASSNIAFCLYGEGQYPFSSIGGLCYAILLGYAVVRYRLMDIEIVLRKGLLYALLTAAVTAVFVGAVLYFQGLLTRQTDWSVLLSTVISTMAVAMFLQPFRGRIQIAIDRRFFRTSYNLQQAVAEFTDAIVSEIDLDQVLKNMIRLIERTFHASKVGIFLVNERKGEYQFATGLGFSADQNPPALSSGHAVVDWLSAHREPVLQADVQWHPLMEEGDLQERVLNELDQLGATVLLPILYESKLRGVVALGDKSSEEPYTIEDLRLLGTVANEAAVAIENARLVEALREEDRRKARFITDMAHELKTPVTSIKLFAQILEDGVEDAAKRKQFLRILANESDRYVNLVNDFLYFTRIESPDFPLRKEEVSLYQLLDETLALFQVQAQEKNISLCYNPGITHDDRSSFPPVCADRDRLKQVFVNLVNNAIKYSHNGGQVVVDISRNGEYCITRISDTGIGIPPEELPSIFEKYYRSHHAREMVGAGGAGIGLTIARDIVQKHGGVLTVESEVEKGSTFIVRLPVE